MYFTAQPTGLCKTDWNVATPAFIFNLEVRNMKQNSGKEISLISVAVVGWLVGWLVLRHVNSCWVVLCESHSIF